MYKGTLTVCLALLLAACSSMSQEVKCATAERDIKRLEANIKSIPAITYPDPYINQVNKEIDKIKATCGL